MRQSPASVRCSAFSGVIRTVVFNSPSGMMFTGFSFVDVSTGRLRLNSETGMPISGLRLNGESCVFIIGRICRRGSWGCRRVCRCTGRSWRSRSRLVVIGSTVSTTSGSVLHGLANGQCPKVDGLNEALILHIREVKPHEVINFVDHTTYMDTGCEGGLSFLNFLPRNIPKTLGTESVVVHWADNSNVHEFFGVSVEKLISKGFQPFYVCQWIIEHVHVQVKIPGRRGHVGVAFTLSLLDLIDLFEADGGQLHFVFDKIVIPVDFDTNQVPVFGRRKLNASRGLGDSCAEENNQHEHHCQKQ